MDYYIWFDGFEDWEDGGEGRDVAVEILHAVGIGTSITVRVKVDHGDGARVGGV